MNVLGFPSRRLTLFAGHYGSGKTNLALAWAHALRRAGETRVAVADLDIVNPYFRTKDAEAELAADGIELVVSPYANSNVDFPALPKETYALVADRSLKVVIDVGGDDRGALALGRYVDDIRAEGDYEMLAVFNAARPLTRTCADAVGVLREIEEAAKLRFTGLVNNTNLGPETTPETVLDSVALSEEVAAALGVSVRFTSCPAALAPALSDRIPNLFPLAVLQMCYNLR